ncbi:MAG: hypothetical protein Q9217_006040 [Psora testacea]
MEVSPLTQQERPSSFQPKIDQLYDELFRQEDEDTVDSDGFWREFFLLRPDKPRLQQRLQSLHPDDLLQLQHETQQLFCRAVQQVKVGKGPMDENALDTLTVFLGVILPNRYTNQSADVIAVIAGLDEVDAVFLEFAMAIEGVIRNGRTVDIRQKAIEVALSVTSGAYQTGLVSYFTHRDLFPALMKCINDLGNPQVVSKAFLLLGLLANYNKFELRNPYQLRLEDFVNESIVQRIVRALGTSMATSRDRYVALQEDIAEGWTFTNTLNYIGLGALAPSRPSTPTPKADDKKEDFGELPEPSVAVLLGTYDFTIANKIFCFNLISSTAEPTTAEPPFSAFLSFTSYLLHHAYRSSRATMYGLLNLLILRIVIEDLVLCKSLCDSEATISVRLCRQRQPFLPATPKPRPPVAHLLDILIDTINHNLRRNLDLQLYISTIGLMHRLLSYLTFTRTRLSYHWSLLWQALLSFLRFLTTYASNFTIENPELPHLLKPFLATLVLAVIMGESFLPDPAAYDDLFYKLVEAGDFLSRFKTTFAVQITQAHEMVGKQPISTINGPTTALIDVLIQVSAHYYDLVQAERDRGRLGNNPSPREVSKIIRQGYDTLSLPTIEGLDRWDRFREAEERGMLKRAARVAVEDTKRLLRGT